MTILRQKNYGLVSNAVGLLGKAAGYGMGTVGAGALKLGGLALAHPVLSGAGILGLAALRRLRRKRAERQQY